MPVIRSQAHANDHVGIFDGLRGIAILVVVWYHLWLVAGVQPSLIAQTGFMGVDLFFFVSGFCLFCPYARTIFEDRAPQTLATFVERRVEKIFPSYFVALAVMAVAHAAWFASGADFGWNVFAHALFIHPLWWNTFGSISGPFWTLGVEVQFYVLFPFIVRAFARRPVLVFAGMTLVAHGYRLLIAHLGVDNALYPTNQLPSVLDVFGSGMLAAYVVGYLCSHKADFASRSVCSVGVVAAGAVIFFLLNGLLQSSVAGGPAAQYAWLNGHRALFAAGFFALAICSSRAIPIWESVLANPILRFFAATSYNIYLWHLEVIVWLTQLHAAPLICAAVAMTTGWAATMVIERPLLKGGWRALLFGGARRPVPDGAAALGRRLQTAHAPQRGTFVRAPIVPVLGVRFVY